MNKIFNEILRETSSKYPVLPREIKGKNLPAWLRRLAYDSKKYMERWHSDLGFTEEEIKLEADYNNGFQLVTSKGRFGFQCALEDHSKGKYVAGQCAAYVKLNGISKWSHEDLEQNVIEAAKHIPRNYDAQPTNEPWNDLIGHIGWAWARLLDKQEMSLNPPVKTKRSKKISNWDLSPTEDAWETHCAEMEYSEDEAADEPKCDWFANMAANDEIPSNIEYEYTDYGIKVYNISEKDLYEWLEDVGIEDCVTVEEG